MPCLPTPQSICLGHTGTSGGQCPRAGVTPGDLHPQAGPALGSRLAGGKPRLGEARMAQRVCALPPERGRWQRSRAHPLPPHAILDTRAPWTPQGARRWGTEPKLCMDPRSCAPGTGGGHALHLLRLAPQRGGWGHSQGVSESSEVRVGASQGSCPWAPQGRTVILPHGAGTPIPVH